VESGHDTEHSIISASEWSFMRPLLIVLTVIAAVAGIMYHYSSLGSTSALTPKVEPNTPAPESNASEAIVNLTDSQLSTITVETTQIHSFHLEKEMVGSVAYHEKDIAVDSHKNSALRFVVANISESDGPLIRVGEPVKAKMLVYPDRVFTGKVSALGVTVYDSEGGNPAVDPNTHRVTARCEVADPKNELYPGMLATLAIQVGAPVESVGVPQNGVVRKGDGTMTVWVTQDRKRFEEREVKVGLQQDGYDQILEGLRLGEQVVTNGAVFVSNILYAPPSD